MMAIVKWAVAVWQFSLSEQWQMRHKAVSGVFTPTFGWFQTVGLYQPAGQFTGIWLVLQMFSLGRTSYFQRNHCFYKGTSVSCMHSSPCRCAALEKMQHPPPPQFTAALLRFVLILHVAIFAGRPDIQRLKEDCVPSISEDHLYAYGRSPCLGDSIAVADYPSLRRRGGNRG